MPPQERRHEGFLFWGILLRLDWEPLREHGLTTGVVRHACRLRRDGTRRFLVWGILSHALERSFGAIAPLERRDED